MKRIDLELLATEEGLEIIETTTEANGYPRSLQKAIIGFQSFSQAKELAEKYNLNIEEFRKKDGWDLWHRTGNTMWDTFTLTEDIFGDNYLIFEASQKDSLFQEWVYPLLGDIKDMDKAEEIMSKYRELYDEIDMLDEDEGVLVENTPLGIEVKERITLHPMSYYHDTRCYAVGLIASEDDEDED